MSRPASPHSTILVPSSPIPEITTLSRGSTTEPDTPRASDEAGQLQSYVFARLIPLNSHARNALQATLELPETDVAYHQQFISTITFDGQPTPCYELSLSQLPRFPHVGWVIGKGRRNLPNLGVDLLLAADNADNVAGVHARLNWVKGAGGFFLIADNKRGKKCMINGEIFNSDRRTIPFQNAIMIGECVFALEYVQRQKEEEEQFQVELQAFLGRFHDDENPFVTPTPSEQTATFGEWRVSYTISKGTFGVVYMVFHSRDGRPAAAKQILKSGKNRSAVDREMKMAERISTITHRHIASPFEIRHHKSRTKAEISRIRALLDDSWNPDAYNNITDEYIILSPLLTATFRSLYNSNVLLRDRRTFFHQLLEAVAFLHDNGICHRDIKPDNILVRSYHPPDAMLADFGCASDAERILYDWPGTIPYLAPEEVEGEYHGCEVDYWACGLVGIELLGGPKVTQRVLPGPRLQQFQEWHNDREDVAAACCRGMLQLSPDARMTALEARDRLLKVVSSPVEERRPEFLVPPPPKRKSLRRTTDSS